MSAKNTGLSRLIKAFGYSLSGLKHVFASEAAFRQECLLCLILLPTIFFLHVSKVECVLLIGSLFLVLIAELLNTALEITINRISAEIHPLSKQVKDIGSATVLLALVNAIVVWVVILF